MDIAPPVAYLMKRQDNGRRMISEASRGQGEGKCAKQDFVS